MQSISDPGRPSRRDRRRAQKIVDTAFAEHRLTAADHTLRTQRIAAAHTRGDLAMITRDVLAPTTASLGSALNPTTLSSMRVGSATRQLGLRPAATIDLTNVTKGVRWVIIGVLASFVGICMLGLVVAFFGLAVGGTSGSSGPSIEVTQPSGAPVLRPSTSLLSADGWEQLVTAVESESGTTRVYDAVVYPEYASIGLVADDAVDRRFYRKGAWDHSVAVRTPAAGEPVDLSDIEPDVIARLPGETAEFFDIADATGSYLIINAIASDPTIMVYVQSDDGSQYRRYGLDGEPIAP